MKTVKMNVTNEQTNEKKDQLIKSHPIDDFNVIHLVNIEDKGWQICFLNNIISNQIFNTTTEAEEYIKNNLVKLLLPIITISFEKQTEYRMKQQSKQS